MADDNKAIKTHVVDILGNVIGRDQPIMLMEKAIQLASLLGEENFKDDNVVFFDPFCKAGEILLACAFLSCRAKATSGLVDLDAVKHEIYESKRYFALSPDERHHRLSLRTFLGNDNSHNKDFNHIIRDGHYLSEEDGRLDKQKFEQEFASMIEYIKSVSGEKKIVAVGNPPYGEADGGHGGSAKPIYHLFVEKLMDCNFIKNWALVIPSRWFSGGRNLESFRERILNSRQIKTLTYFSRSEDIFPTVHVQGGVCFLHWEEVHNGLVQFVQNNQSYEADLSQYDIIPDDPEATPIVSKVLSIWKEKFIDDIAWSGKPFGIRTYYFKRNEPIEAGDRNTISCYTKGRKIQRIHRSSIEKNETYIDYWKVAIPKAYATGARRCTLPPHQIFLIESGAICTETYNIVSVFKKRQDAERMVAYLQTDFFRYLLGLRKLTQDIPKDRWAWVPYLDPSKSWSESEMFKLFEITKVEQDHIRKKVKEWS